jgi:hypothetical protein
MVLIPGWRYRPVITTTAVQSNDQQDYAQVPASGFFTSPSSWSVCGWVKIAVDRNTYSGVFTVESSPSTEWNEIITDVDGTTLVFFDHVTGLVLTFGVMTVGSWYFFGATVSGTALSAYFAAEGAASLTKTTGTITTCTTIGQQNILSSGFPSAEFLSGNMALVRTWNGVNSDAEMNLELHSAVPVKTTGLVGDWRLASAATITADSSGNGNTLLVNAGRTHVDVAGPNIS